jgi:hypothetical protein
VCRLADVSGLSRHIMSISPQFQQKRVIILKHVATALQYGVGHEKLWYLPKLAQLRGGQLQLWLTWISVGLEPVGLLTQSGWEKLLTTATMLQQRWCGSQPVGGRGLRRPRNILSCKGVAKAMGILLSEAPKAA